MPGDYHFEVDREISVTTYWGQVSLVDILDTISRRIHDPDFDAAKASVIDLSAATWTEIPPKYIRQELDRLRPALAPPKLRTVFVTPGEFFYGFARMYAIIHVVYGGASVDVVRSWKDAGELLGLDLAASEAWATRRATAGEETQDFRLK